MVKASIKLLLVYLLYPIAFVYSQAEDKACIPEPTDMLIHYGDLISCRIEPPGDVVDLFRFLGNVGEVIIIQAPRRGGGNPCIELRDPDGGSIGSACTGFFGEDPQLRETLQKPGVHTIVVSEGGNDQTMDYGLVLERVVPPSPTAIPLCFGCNIHDEINGIGDLDLYIFNGSTGDSVIAQAVRLSGGNPCIELRDPDGVSIGSACTGFFGENPRLDKIVQKPGVHTIVVSAGHETMEYRLDLQCVSGQCPPLPPPPNTADLSISKTDVPDPVTVGSILTYTIVVTNNGPLAATEVQLRDTLPGRFRSATPDQGSCSLSKNEVVCDLGGLVNAASAKVTIEVTPTAVGVIANRAHVQANEPDPDLCDNTVKAVTTVQPSRRSQR